MGWQCPPDAGFEIWSLAVWGRARHLPATEATHNIESLRVSGEETLCFFELECQSKRRTRDLQLSKQVALTTCTRAPNTTVMTRPYITLIVYLHWCVMYLMCHVTPLHLIALHCIALHCIALHCIALHCIALHCIALHCIALNYINLHYIT